jgi:hypothetical protein
VPSGQVLAAMALLAMIKAAMTALACAMPLIQRRIKRWGWRWRWS